jgi:DNA-binding MarR family transcriptional regulator
MGVETSGRTKRTDLASEAWVAMLQFFFLKGRPRMLELWREFDLMPPQQMMLGLLDEPQAMGELAHQMHCDNSNITGIVDRLTERGLVERRAAEGDRRIKLVALTEAGREMKDELTRRRAIAPPGFADLPAEDLERLHRIFTELAE